MLHYVADAIGKPICGPGLLLRLVRQEQLTMSTSPPSCNLPSLGCANHTQDFAQRLSYSSWRRSRRPVGARRGECRHLRFLATRITLPSKTCMSSLMVLYDVAAAMADPCRFHTTISSFAGIAPMYSCTQRTSACIRSNHRGEESRLFLCRHAVLPNLVAQFRMRFQQGVLITRLKFEGDGSPDPFVSTCNASPFNLLGRR